MSSRPTSVRLGAALAAATIALGACGGGTTPPSTVDALATEEVSTPERYPGSGYVDKARGVSSDVDAYHDSLNNLP